jgi:hypothetical protein
MEKSYDVEWINPLDFLFQLVRGMCLESDHLEEGKPGLLTPPILEQPSSSGAAA